MRGLAGVALLSVAGFGTGPAVAQTGPVAITVTVATPGVGGGAAIEPVRVVAPAPPATVALALSPPAIAATAAVQPSWSTAERSAARLRALQTWLMVGALRCRTGSSNLVADYGSFVTAARATLVAANDRVRARFVAAYGAAEGQVRFDRFTTALANGFGGDGAAPDVCRTLGAAARLAAAEGGSPDRLLLLADLENVGDGLPAIDAPVEIAAR